MANTLTAIASSNSGAPMTSNSTAIPEFIRSFVVLDHTTLLPVALAGRPAEAFAFRRRVISDTRFTRPASSDPHTLAAHVTIATRITLSDIMIAARINPRYWTVDLFWFAMPRADGYGTPGTG
ncbi:hypothetical protein QX204_11770 [Nocardia sp. PE-7]|uniref:hypothetical protein n=1 Tax=Nocardia sp. PE-7 TaxID=3058426 RepID=UPI00265B3A56|nr:hypothetical protein [Nocardia sp. PE-7]WKG13539.1 hypothetical protein QX204_11770 [Nocardia sp. PE-7]